MSHKNCPVHESGRRRSGLGNMPAKTDGLGTTRNFACAGQRCRRGYQTVASTVYGDLYFHWSGQAIRI